MLRFDPPENATYAEKQPSDGWVSCGWLALDTWRAGRGYREIARDLGCSAGLLTTWKQGRTPVKTYLEKLEKLADIAPIAWSYWVCLDPSKATADNPPPSDPPPSVAVDAEIKLGSTIDELRASVARLTGILAKGKLSPAQVAQLEGKRISALIAISKQEQAGKLEDHPEFDQFSSDIREAIKEVFYPSPDQLRALGAVMRRKGAEQDARKRAA